MTESTTDKENRLVQENMGLVVTIAKCFHPRDMNELDEFIHVGSIGLWKAIKKHDPKQGALSTISWPYIYYGILRIVKDNYKHKQFEVLFDDSARTSSVPSLWEFIPTTLTLLEKTVVSLRFEYGFTFKEIGTYMGGYTRGWANKLFKVALKKIQKANE